MPPPLLERYHAPRTERTARGGLFSCAAPHRCVPARTVLWLTLLLYCASFTLVRAQEQPVDTATCTVPTVRIGLPVGAKPMQRIQYTDLNVQLDVDSAYQRFLPLDIFSDTSGRVDVSITKAYAIFRTQRYTLELWMNEQGAVRRLAVGDALTCTLRDEAFDSLGNVEVSFQCDYSTPNDCLYVEYRDGKPHRFTECRPLVFREATSTRPIVMKEYAVEVMRKGTFDGHGMKRYSAE
ncbi:MAG: hypothetical protein JNM62_00150 [Flavobacteriales bacterium]|nr:hypothetical protein [Flavobacteriales bacterium]